MQRDRPRKTDHYSEDFTQLFNAVVDAALTTVTQIGPNTVNHEGSSRIFKPRPDVATEFRCDVQKATQIALDKCPHLWGAFSWLLKDVGGLRNDGDRPSAGKRAEVIHRCGKIFMARHLHPASYFRKVHRRVKYTGS
ncbi:MAG TPA: hypothetical protein VHZ09_19325 [Acidobacteriaceae bacterium]|nr:hypothetical protein [Acidobacteriaceae bacterium]